MPRNRKRKRPEPETEVTIEDCQKILHNLIEKAQQLTDKDIWNHELGRKRGKKKHRATEAEEDDELMHETELETDYRHLEVQPSIIQNGTLRPYQLAGVNWMINLRESQLNGILADEMGLGKTFQTIALFAYLREAENINGKHLITVPKSTIHNWLREFNRWCPVFNVFALEGNKEERKKIISQRIKTSDFDVCICSYEICMIEKAALRKIEWCYIAVDEAHRLKNDASKFGTILRTFKSKHRLLITGTPLQNNLRELWSLLNFLLPNLFDSAEDFEALFSFGRSEEDQAQIFESLRFLLQPFLLRRLKKEAEKDLPPKTETILFVGMSEVQQDIYRKILMKEMDTIGGEASKTRLLNLVMQLRKCCNHPYLFDGVEDMSLDPFGDHLIRNAGKLVLLDKLLVRLKAQGSRCLIFSQMTRVLDILEDYARSRGYTYCRIDGSTPGEERQQQMDDFNAPESPIFLFLLTTRAGGLGINLQTADIVIIYDSDWNPQMDLQAMDRVHRIGQTKPVFVYRLVSKDSVEERILERAELKLRLDAMVIQKHRTSAGAKKGTKTDIFEMIQYGAQQIFKANESTITDDDIELILSQGEARTEELRQKWEKASQKRFDELKTSYNYQTFKGEDYSKQREENIKNERTTLLQLMHEKLGNKSRRMATKIGRTRSRVNYNVDSYYREKIQGLNNRNAHLNNKNDLTAPQKLPDMKYWHLFNEEKLFQIYSKEWEFFTKYRNSDKYEPDMKALTDAEEKEKEVLLNEGFPEISYRDFGAFIRACMKHGKDNVKAIIEFMDEVDPAVIRQYYTAFFEKAPSIPELTGHLERIEEAEKKRIARSEREKLREEKALQKEERRKIWQAKREEAQRKRELKEKERKQKEIEQKLKYRAVLHERVQKWKMAVQCDVYKPLPLPDAGGEKKSFTKALDRFLFLTAYELGYDRWELLKQRVLLHPEFRFDFLVYGLSPDQLKHRVDTIVRACISSKSSNKGKKKKTDAKNGAANGGPANGGPPTKKRRLGN